MAVKRWRFLQSCIYLETDLKEMRYERICWHTAGWILVILKISKQKGEAMAEALQRYFDFWFENFAPQEERWFKTLSAHLEFIGKLKEKIKEKVTIKEEFEEILQELMNDSGIVEQEFCEFVSSDGNRKEKSTLESFLQTYVFGADCGVGNIGQGRVYNTKDNPHADKFVEHMNNNFNRFLQLFKEDNCIEAMRLIDELFNENIIEDSSNPRNYDAAKHRLLRTLLPHCATSLDAKDRFWTLLTQLRDKLAIDLFDVCKEHGDYQRVYIETDFLMSEIECKEISGFDCLVLKQMFYWDLYDSLLVLELGSKKAVVFYGAPGTGKTRRAKIEAKSLIDSWKLKLNKKEASNHIKVVQFHPSFGYKDFIEGLRPNKDGRFEKVDGVFKEFCKKAGELELKLWSDKGFRDRFQDREFCKIRAKEAYEAIEDKSLKERLQEYKDSNFTLEDILEPAVFIIDEINRAEISKVFGELMYALEYRGYGGRVKTQYAYLPSDEPYFEENGEEYFFAPHNVYIFATMNTIDRSVDIFDFAMRRRFAWERMEIDYGAIKEVFADLDAKIVKNKENHEVGEELAASLKKLNEAIADEPMLGHDYMVGHAYIIGFAKCNTKIYESVSKLKEEIWSKSLKPLLEEYVKGLMDSKEIEGKLQGFEKNWKS